MPRGARKPYERPGKAPAGLWTHDRADQMDIDERSSRRQPAQTPGVTSKIVVSNLHYEVSVKDLIAIFGQVGTLVRDPNIRYDRSGRSTGVAIITYETDTEAKRAKSQFDGILAKGQPMAISYDSTPMASRPRTRSTSAPPSSLMHRLDKIPLVERMTKDDSSTNGGAVRRGRRSAGDAAATATIDGSAPRKPGHRRQVRAPKPSKPKTVEDLDQELDAFMGSGDAATTNGAAPEIKDVEMS